MIGASQPGAPLRVVKIGGRAQSDPTLPALLAAAVATPGARCVVVHGGGDEVTALQRRLGGEPTFVNGRRVTTPEDVDLVRMVLSGLVNKRLVGQLLGAGVRAVGLSGEDGALLTADLFDGGALGAVGIPTAADARVVTALLDAGFVPVVSPLARDADTGSPLNVNGDDAAAMIAVSLGAAELLLVADVPGVLGADGLPLGSVDLDAAARLVTEGVARGGRAAKLDAARRALAGGVPVVRIAPVAALGDPTLGTVVTLSPSVV
ncbi:MAG TPA: acetylglutamate kinase [Gemmatimonadaceae bacterium]